jgi:hypothetical protein
MVTAGKGMNWNLESGFKFKNNLLNFIQQSIILPATMQCSKISKKTGESMVKMPNFNPY